MTSIRSRITGSQDTHSHKTLGRVPTPKRKEVNFAEDQPTQHDDNSIEDMDSKRLRELNPPLDDGTMIDYVFAFVDKKVKRKKSGSKLKDGLAAAAVAERHKIRTSFMNHLTHKTGYKLRGDMTDPMDSPSGIHSFLRLHVPTTVMEEFASIRRLEVPLKQRTGNRQRIRYLDQQLSWAEVMCCGMFRDPFKLPRDIHDDFVKGPLRERFKFDVQYEKLDDQYIDYFETGEDGRPEFDFIQRTIAATEIANHAVIDVGKGMVSIDSMISDKVFVAAYPLHDGPSELPIDPDSGKKIKLEISEMNDRQILRKIWANFCCIFKYQPLWLIQRYFGINLGMYFAWMGFYTQWLAVPALFGVICILVSIAATVKGAFFIPATSEIFNEICNATKYTSPTYLGNRVMCPRCPHWSCDFWTLKESCSKWRFGRVFDNPVMLAFGAFLQVWSFLYLRFWERKENQLKWEWRIDTTHQAYEEEMRVEYQLAARATATNPITGSREPQVPKAERVLRRLISWLAWFLTFLISLLIFKVSVYFRGLIYTALSSSDLLQLTNCDAINPNVTDLMAPVRDLSKTKGIADYDIIASLLSALITVTMIIIANQIDYVVCGWMADFEAPRSKSQFEALFSYKVLILYLLNYMLPLGFIAFLKDTVNPTKFVFARVHTLAHIGNLIVGRGGMSCDVAGCMSELVLQLILNSFTGIVIASIFLQFTCPLFRRWLIQQGWFASKGWFDSWGGVSWHDETFKQALLKPKRMFTNPARLRKPSSMTCKTHLRAVSSDAMHGVSDDLNRNSDDITQRQWEADLELLEQPLPMFLGERLDLAMQWSFIVCFSPCSAAVPLLAFLSNIINIRLQAKAYVCHYRRPTPYSSLYTGHWAKTFRFISTLGIFTSALIITHTSDSFLQLLYVTMFHAEKNEKFFEWSLSEFPVQLVRLWKPQHLVCYFRRLKSESDLHRVDSYRWAFALVYITCMLGIRSFVDYFVPTHGPELEKRLMKDDYMARRKVKEAGFEPAATTPRLRRVASATPSQFPPAPSEHRFVSHAAAMPALASVSTNIPLPPPEEDEEELKATITKKSRARTISRRAKLGPTSGRTSTVADKPTQVTAAPSAAPSAGSFLQV